MRLRPLARSSAPGSENSPMKVGAMHLIRSSSTPPAVVTSTSTYVPNSMHILKHQERTILCCTKNRMMSLRPLEMRFDV